MKPKRKPLSTRTRFEVFKRDHFKCVYCGKTPPDVVLHVDHILAIANGGTNDPVNLVTSCQDCNLGKSSVPLDAIPQSLVESQQAQQERQAQIDAFGDWYRNKLKNDQLALNKIESHYLKAIGVSPKDFALSDYVMKSIRMFLGKTCPDVILEAIKITENKFSDMKGSRNFEDHFFRYFCGVTWNLIRGFNH